MVCEIMRHMRLQGGFRMFRVSGWCKFLPQGKWRSKSPEACCAHHSKASVKKGEV